MRHEGEFVMAPSDAKKTQVLIQWADTKQPRESSIP